MQSDEKDMIEDLSEGVTLEPPVDLQLPADPVIHRKPEKRPFLFGTWTVWYQVTDVASLTLEQARRVIVACVGKRGEECDEHLSNWLMYEPRELWVDIDYPLNRGVRLCVKPLVVKSEACEACEREGDRRKTERLEMSPGYFLWMVAKEYERIYAEHEKYGVWGHALTDLGFERITIKQGGVVELGVGS